MHVTIAQGGGIHGQTIDLRTLDDGYEPDRCKANTDKLIKDESSRCSATWARPPAWRPSRW